MTDPQQQFADFIMARIESGEEKPAQALLAEAFANRSNTAIGPEYLSSFRNRLLPMIKPENLDEVRTVLANFTLNSH